MIDVKSKKATSLVNYKKALIFIARKKLFKPLYFGKTKAFSGYQNIGFFKSNGEITINVSLAIEKGKATLAIVQNHNVYIITDENCNKTVKLTLDTGRARLRLIGEKANIKYKISFLK